MPVTSSTQSSVLNSSNLTLDLPVSDASLDLFAAVTFYKVAAGTPTVTTPSGWTLIDTQNVSTSQCQVALFWKVGDGSTSVTFAFSAVCHAVAGCVSLPGRASSPYQIASVAFRTSTTLFSSNSLTTTPPNETLLGIWAGYPLTPPFSPVTMQANVSIGGNQPGPDGSLPPLLIAEDFQAVMGPSGTRSASTIASGSGTVFLIGWKPDDRPTVPSVLYAAGGESLTSGATVALTCTAASSPSVATSVLQYEFSYSLDNGGTWTVIGLSPVGVAAKTWTVPATLGNTNLIRVRAFDGTLYSPVYGYGAAFSIVAETIPSVAITSPLAGSTQAKSATQPIAWSFSGGQGNPQTQFTLQWATNALFTLPTTVGPTSSATQSTTINTSGLTDGQTVYVRVKAKGVSLYSAYSSAVAFTVASAPATPNITAPIAASPPASSTYTVTFTESSAFVARRFRVIQAGVVVWDTTTLANVLSFLSPYAFANGVAVTIYLSVQNQYGLWSAEDSETVTPAYTGPTKPTATYNLNHDNGYVLAVITNSGSISYNVLYSRASTEAKSLAIPISPHLAANAQFEDHSPGSADGRIYFVRCFSGALFTDSDDSSTQTLTLTRLHVHAVSTSNTSSNVAGIPLATQALENSDGHGFADASAMLDLIGRTSPGVISAQNFQELLPFLIRFDLADSTGYQNFLDILSAQRGNGTILRARNSLSDAIYGKVGQITSRIDVDGYWISGVVEQSDYSPAIT